jgi:hypothetical protein
VKIVIAKFAICAILSQINEKLYLIVSTNFTKLSHENLARDIDFHPSMYEAAPHGGVI